ncbi:hypothetical protein EV127DRAFT_406040 [Xylaria flabelliformis]|nr:hypothetical protein EV127DRAFT_406040 [Xylaria flabelliformis]
MAGHRGQRIRGDTVRARDSASDRTLVSHHQRPASPENAYLTTPRRHTAGGTSQRRDSAYGHAETERSTSFSKPRSHSLSSSSASTVEIADGRRSPSQSHRPTSTSEIRARIPCHRLKNNKECKFGQSCRYSHDLAPTAPREEPREEPQEETPEAAGLAYYPSWGANGMQGVPIIMMPAFLPQGSLGTQLRLQDVAMSMNTDHLPHQIQKVYDGTSSIDVTHFPRPSNLGNEKDEKPALSPRQQQKQQRWDKPDNQAEKHADRHDTDEEQRYKQNRATYTLGKKSDKQERRRGEALASLDVVRDDTAHRRSASRSSSGDASSTYSFYEDRHGKRTRTRETTRRGMRSTIHSLDAFEDRIATAAAAEVEIWRRGQQQQERTAAKDDEKTDGGRARAASPPGSPPPGTTKKVYRTNNNQSSKSHAHAHTKKNPGSRGEGSRGGQAHHMPNGNGKQNQQQRYKQRFSNNGGQQQPRRSLPPPGPYKGQKSQTHASKRTATYQAQQRYNQQRKQSSSSSGQQPGGWGGVQRRVSHSPDAFEDEIAMAAAAEEEKCTREQEQTTKVKAKPTSIVSQARKANGSSWGSQSTKVSGWAQTERDETPNLIDV